MSYFNIVTRSDICREFNCHPDTVKRWIKEEGFPKPLPCKAREPVFDANSVNDWIRGRYGQFALDHVWAFMAKNRGCVMMKHSKISLEIINELDCGYFPLIPETSSYI